MRSPFFFFKTLFSQCEPLPVFVHFFISTQKKIPHCCHLFFPYYHHSPCDISKPSGESLIEACARDTLFSPSNGHFDIFPHLSVESRVKTKPELLFFLSLLFVWFCFLGVFVDVFTGAQAFYLVLRRSASFYVFGVW